MTRFKHIVIAAITLFSATAIHAQDSLWADHCGGSLNESGQSVLVRDNGDIVVFGSTYSYGAGSHDLYLMVMDSSGIVHFDTTFGGLDTDYGYAVTETSDGGLVLVGSSKSISSGDYDVLVIGLDENYTLRWIKNYGGLENDRGQAVAATTDGGCLITGTTSSLGLSADFYALRLDSLGDTVWTNTYGGPAGETGMGVCMLPDGAALVGSTGSYGEGYSSIYLVRIDLNGDTLWTATYGGVRADFGYDVMMLPDNGLIIAGATAPDGKSYYDGYLIRTDEDGGIVWQYTYGGSLEDRLYALVPSIDGGIIATGVSERSGGRKHDGYLLKVDAEGGLLWERFPGGIETDVLFDIAMSPSGEIVAVGHSYSAGAGGSDVFLTRYSNSDFTSVDWIEPSVDANDWELGQNYPNPFNAETKVKFTLYRAAGYDLTIYNILGQEIRYWSVEYAPAGVYEMIWDGRDDYGAVVASGVYLYRLRIGSYHETKRMVLIK